VLLGKQYTQKTGANSHGHGGCIKGSKTSDKVGSVGKRELACSKGRSYKGVMLAFSIAADPRRKCFFQSVVHGGRKRRCKAQCDCKCSGVGRNINIYDWQSMESGQ